jgi:hypothetical protein
MKRTLNGKIFVEPFVTNDVKVNISNGFAKIDQRHSLTELKVLVGNATIPAGSVVTVLSELCKAHWAMKKYTLDGVEGIFMPETDALMVNDSSPPPEWKYRNVSHPDSKGEF